MHPSISAFPRAAFYDSKLCDGPNVQEPSYTKDYHKVCIYVIVTVIVIAAITMVTAADSATRQNSSYMLLARSSY
jgi:hypothetical protein